MNTRVCMRARREKLFNYFDIEPKYISLTEDCFVATPDKIAAACDKNTIGVVAILGTTYSGHFEDVEGIDSAVGEPHQLVVQQEHHAQKSFLTRAQLVFRSTICRRLCGGKGQWPSTKILAEEDGDTQAS